MTLFLKQRKPGPEAIQKGLDAVTAGLNRRYPEYRWRCVESPPGTFPGPRPDSGDGREQGEEEG